MGVGGLGMGEKDGQTRKEQFLVLGGPQVQYIIYFKKDSRHRRGLGFVPKIS